MLECINALKHVCMDDGFMEAWLHGYINKLLNQIMDPSLHSYMVAWKSEGVAPFNNHCFNNLF